MAKNLVADCASFSRMCGAEEVFASWADGDLPFLPPAYDIYLLHVSKSALPEGKPVHELCAPCGICRQVLAEFCGPDFPVYLWDGSGAPQCVPLSRLLPATFSAAALGKIPKSEWITNKNTD